MMRKILLNSRRSKISINETNIIPVEINRDYSMFHDEKLTETIDTLQIYNSEKDNSTKHRFIFTINSLCTNILFNNITEVVYKEGSSDAKLLNGSIFNKNNITELTNAVSSSDINQIQAIRNTEYSNDIFNITYHCGSDIFNNHLLRKKDEVTVLPISGSTVPKFTLQNLDNIVEKDAFNTIGDYNRNNKGTFIKSIMPDKNKNYCYNKGSNKKNLPLYIFDTITSFGNTFNEKLKKENGWIGFNNPTTLQIPIKKIDEKDYYVNKCINNAKSCQFIDMAPERDLFYFTPKKNTYRNRLEYNWDYCLTYPANCVYQDNTGILKGKENGLPTLPFTSEDTSFYTINDNNNNNLCYEYEVNGTILYLFRCPVCHNLKSNDTILIKFFSEQGNELFAYKTKVVSIGTPDKKENERYFSIRKSEFTGNGSISSISNVTVKEIRFLKIKNGYKCEYYFRRFKKFDVSHKNSLNRLAFSENIYGDEISQITYLDDININDYRDNLGRPLSEIYLTIIKTNRGHELWYDNYNGNKYDPKPNDARVEYSHVFGKVTSGLDLPSYVKDNCNIRYQHNITKTVSDSDKKRGINIPTSSTKIESDITLNGTGFTNGFYGDLIELDISELKETVLEKVKHRFNTAQREIDNSTYNTVFYDEIGTDVYDSTDNEKITIIQNKMDEGYANLNPEGYIYEPHHKVKIGDFYNNVKERSHFKLKIESVISTDNYTKFNTINNYGLLPNDILLCEYNNNLTRYIITKIDTEIVNNKKQYVFYIDDKISYNTNMIFYQKHRDTPDYVYTVLDKTGRCVWKDILPMSKLTFDNDLYNIPFTNGAFYHHTNIIFPVKRQNPFGEYNIKISGLINNFNTVSQKLDISDNEYIPENRQTSCF